MADVTAPPTPAALAPERSSIVRTSLRLLPAQLFVRLAEAFFPILLAGLFGRSYEMDAFMQAWATFTFAGALVLDAHRDSALVPLIAELRRHDEAALPAFLGSVLGHTVLVSAGIGLVIALVLTVLAVMSGHGPMPMVPLAACFAIQLVGACTRAFLGGTANAVSWFFAPVWAGALAMAFTLVITLLGRSALGVAAIPLGMAVGEAAGVLLLLALARRQGLAFSLSLRRRSEWVRRFARQSVAQVAGGALARISPMVDQLMSGLAGVVGGGTLLRLASDLALSPSTLVQVSLLPVLLTHFAERAAEQRYTEIKRLVVRAIAVTSTALTVVGGALVIFREPLVRLVYQHGVMDEGGVAAMADLVPYFALGLPGQGALLVLARAHVAIGNSRALLFMGALNAVLNAGLNLWLVRTLGLGGLALSTAITITAIAVAFGWMLRTRLRALLAGTITSS